MEKTKRKLRSYSKEFKFSVVQEYLLNHGSISIKTLCEKHSIPSRASIHEWLRIFAAKHKLKETDMGKKELSEKEEIAALKNALRQKELELTREKMRGDFYETMVEVAEEQFNIPIRKKAGTKR